MTYKILLIYDIICQWLANHKTRFGKYHHLNLPSKLEIIAGIGKFHLAVHLLPCFFRYSLDFILGAAQVDGEVVETLWAELDKVAGFVRGMSSAHRQEVLDDMMIHSNWKKLVGMPMFLISKLDRAQAGLADMREAFENLSNSVGTKLVKEWTKQEIEAFKDGGVGSQIYESVDAKSKLFSLEGGC